ncbi:MAG: hypothetical protein ABH835_01570 [Patescibacteria group bacterium]|nr:hypothetical protein [Patescibacteria group bacterium]
MIIKLFKTYFFSLAVSMCVVVSVAMFLNFIEESFFQKAEAKDINMELEVEQVSDYLQKGCVGSYHQSVAIAPIPRLPQVENI